MAKIPDKGYLLFGSTVIQLKSIFINKYILARRKSKPKGTTHKSSFRYAK